MEHCLHLSTAERLHAVRTLLRQRLRQNYKPPANLMAGYSFATLCQPVLELASPRCSHGEGLKSVSPATHPLTRLFELCVWHSACDHECHNLVPPLVKLGSG